MFGGYHHLGKHPYHELSFFNPCIHQTNKLNLSITSRSSQLSLESRVTSGTSAKRPTKKRNETTWKGVTFFGSWKRRDKPTTSSHASTILHHFTISFCQISAVWWFFLKQSVPNVSNQHMTMSLSLTWFFWTDRGYGRVQDFPYFQPVLPWHGDLDGCGYAVVMRHISKTHQYFSAAIYIYKWIVCWELFVVVWDIFHFHPDPWGFMIQFDEHIFHMGWFNHRIKPASLKLYFLSDTKFIFSVVPRSRSISQSQTQWQLAWHHVQVGDVSKWYRRWKKSQTITWDVSQTL